VKEVRCGSGSGFGGAGVAGVLLRNCSRGTPLEGSRLVVQVLPVVLHCEPCGLDAELDSLQSFRCPRCGKPRMICAKGGAGD